MCDVNYDIQGAKLIYSDENLYVFNKNPGVSVIPGRGENQALSLQRSVEKITGEKIYIVHRIDRDTSGLIVLCRNAETHRWLCQQFEKGKVHKEYRALILGTLHGNGIINKPIYQFGSGRMGIHENGKPSITEYVVDKTFANVSLLKVIPRTGRRHQIRVHLYSIGHPIVGDRRYGKNRPVGGVERMMLHAASISFSHPNGEIYSIDAKADDEWNDILGKVFIEGVPFS